MNEWKKFRTETVGEPKGSGLDRFIEVYSIAADKSYGISLCAKQGRNKASQKSMCAEHKG